MRARRIRKGFLAAAAVTVSVGAGSAAASPLSLFISNQGNVALTPGGAANFAGFTVGTGGALTPFSGSPFSLPGTKFPYSPAFTPDGKTMFIDDQVSSVYAYSVGAGTLTAGPVTSTGASTEPATNVVTPNGSKLYVVDLVGKISGFSIGTGGTLTPLPGSPYTVPAGTSQPEAMAITPDGGHLYVSGFVVSGNTIAEFSINADGSLTTVPGSPVAVGPTTNGMRITPNGRFLYTTNQGAPGISSYSIGPGGALSAIAAPTPPAKPKSPPAITRDGAHLYTGLGSGAVAGYTIAVDGTLTVLPGSPYPGLATFTSGLPWDLELPADSGVIYAVYAKASLTSDGTLAAFDVGSTGVLTLRAGTANTGGTEPFQGSMAVSPDPGPMASFTAAAAHSGLATSFDARASSASVPAYASLRYDWSFGDGSSGPNAGAIPRHVYANAGNYRVTLTVTDAAGCSSALVFTGASGYCSRDLLASITHTVSISAPDTKITKVKLDKKHHRAKFSFKAIGKATGFQCALIKQKKHHKNPKPSFSACHSPKIYKHLNPGKYTFKVRALSAGLHGTPATKSFKIA